ncbi:N-acetylneuraminate synthase family protein [Alphaproteobacteria bacterium]|nr:N-acetylneuraminate synthase family protein [Alphaproteobacteria bacterium]
MSPFSGRNGVYLIAEIGGNHEGNFEYAKELTYLAAESGVDAIKYQIYSGNTLVNSAYDPDRVKHFDRFALTRAQYIELAQLCGSLGVKFMASVWDIDSIDAINSFSEIFKVGSGDLTAWNLIAKFVSTGKPLILSTGLATLDEVIATVDFIKSLDSSYVSEKKIALLQCSSMYPIPDSDANLNVIHEYMKNFDFCVGYSDHTEGTEAIYIAAIMGAKIIEVHFTDSRENKSFRDHRVSLTKNEIKEFLQKMARVGVLQGSRSKQPTTSEVESGHIVSFRRSVYAKTDIPAGHRIEESDLLTLRPKTGLGAEKFYSIVGRRTKGPISRLGKFEHDDLIE